MKVFVSHSMKDQSILDGIRNPLKVNGIELLLAEHEIDLKNSTTEKIKKMIESCHLGLILLTKEGLKSGFVREEIGYLEAKQKPSLIIFEKGVKKMYGGFKFGCDYVELDPNFPEKAVESVNQILINHWNTLKNKQLAIEQEQKSALIGLGILAGLIILIASN